jgi:hypothetical protein
MRIVTVSTAGARPDELFLVDGEWAAILAGERLRIVDVRHSDPPTVVEVPDIAGAAIASGTSGTIITLDRQGQVDRWTRREGGLARAARTSLPSPVVGPGGRAVRLAVSPCGRFVLVDGGRAVLVDLDREVVVTTLEGALGTVRPCFARLPGGRDVLIAAAPGYMDVRIIDAVSGHPLAVRDATSGLDFCHVDFRLAAGGTRLVTFGCVWAAPYEARIYDSASWTAAVEAELASPVALMLELVAGFEPVASNTLLPFDVPPATAGGDRSITIASIELAADLAPDEDGDLPSNLVALGATEPALAAQLRAAAERSAHCLVARCVDPIDGSTVRAVAHPIARVCETDVHHLDGHRIALLGERVQILDVLAGKLHDVAPLGLAVAARTAVARNGSIAVIASP